MRFKLYFVTLISVLSVFIASTVCASGIFGINKVELNNGLITVNGTAKNPETWVSVAIFKKSTHSVFYVNEVKSDENGFFEISLRLPESLKNEETSGVFQIVASSELSVDDSKTFEYVSASARQNFFDSLTAENIQQEIEKEENAVVFKTLGVDLESYNNLTPTQKEEAIDFLLENNQWSKISVGNLAEKVNYGIYATMIQAGETSDALDKLDILYDDVKYSKISDSEHKEYICDNMNKVGYDTEEEIYSDYTMYYSLYLLNNAKTSEYITLLKKHKEAFILNNSSAYSYVSSLTGEKATKAGRKLAQLMEKGDEINSKEELDAILDDVYDYMNEKSGSSSGSGGGGGGSSSGGRGGTNMALPITNTAEMPEETEIQVSDKVFSDIESVPWAGEAINAMAQMNIINGVGDGRFLPENKVKREEFVKMLVLSLGTYEADSKCNFDDVSEDNWAYSYIASAVNLGYVKGIDDKNFGFGEYVTRQDAAVLIARALNLAKASRIDVFEDDSEISEYAKDAVYALCEMGVINGIGDNRFAPMDACTRAMAAKMIYSAIPSGGVN